MSDGDNLKKKVTRETAFQFTLASYFEVAIECKDTNT